MAFDLQFQLRTVSIPSCIRATTKLQELIAVFVVFALYSLLISPARAQQVRTSSSDIAPTTTFLIVRHADRDGELDALTEAGQARAQQLSELSGILNVTAVYSTNFERSKNTALPAAQARGLEIQIYEQLTADWLERVRSKNQGGVVLIVGHSNTVGEIVKQLSGETTPEILHDEYDRLFVISSREKFTSLVRLRYGPSTTGAPAAAPNKMGPEKK